ncbi:endolytic transglycosylase MltG [Naasia aerilata]|uniref:Endolytic murein transglycosylase n=1 Tax=Naasia aerilata TaxID=1162966 RepID=A0ABN6XPL2_9MICO|nr:endolytic transglycosylase MltG [Naasia aerilata]BDZ46954.1 ABC transporter substrate-binding protein [Naasia aerilata]
MSPTRRELREREAAHIAGRVRSRGGATASYGFPETAPPPRRRRWLAWIIAPLVLVLVLGGGAFTAASLLFPQQLHTLIFGAEKNDYEGSGSGDAILVIHEGDIGQDVAKNLVAAGVTKTFDSFYGLLLATEPAPVFQPGAYQLKQHMSARAALDRLLDPASKLENQVAIPEGETMSSVLQLVSDGTQIPVADLQAAAADVASFGLPAEATSLEGFLFPATYQFDPGVTAHDALKVLVDRSFQALDAAGVAPQDRWRTVVLASLVQKEAGLRDDYYKVSRVFLNRLDQGMLLQSDATVAYGTGNTHRVATTDAERADGNNPYNTYVHPGLPVGPISNPGDLAIDAALHPADGPWLFFVTVNLETGETVFSENEEQHEAAVQQWLAWMDDHPEYQ